MKNENRIRIALIGLCIGIALLAYKANRLQARIAQVEAAIAAEAR